LTGNEQVEGGEKLTRKRGGKDGAMSLLRGNPSRVWGEGEGNTWKGWVGLKAKRGTEEKKKNEKSWRGVECIKKWLKTASRGRGGPEKRVSYGSRRRGVWRKKSGMIGEDESKKRRSIVLGGVSHVDFDSP